MMLFRKKITLLFGGLLLLVSFLKLIHYLNQSPESVYPLSQWYHEINDEMPHQPLEAFFKRNRLLLTKVQRHLATAHRYSRNSITINEIKQAFSLLNRVILNEEKKEEELIQQHISQVNLSSMSHKNLVDVCPELRRHKKADYPLYNTQIETTNCSNSKPFSTVVGFAVMTANCSTARSIIDGISTRYSGMRAELGIASSEDCKIDQSKKFESLSISSGLSQTGAGWKQLISKLNTKYVLISRNLYTFDNQSSLERLVRISSESGIDAVGGAQRFEDGRWMSGCYQMAMRNYTLRLLEGYDLSYKSCMYCDYLSTAFLSPADVLLNKLDDKMVGNAVFVDFFTRLFQPHKIGAMMCVDVMFSSDYQDINDQSRFQWQQIAIKYRLNRIVLPNNQDVWFDCEESKVGCPKNKGELVPPCCLKELSDAYLTMIKICQELKLNCTIISGGLVGALKFADILPWERDEDIEFHVRSPDQFKNAITKKGYKVYVKHYYKTDASYQVCLKSGIDCIYFGLTTKNWNIEMYGGGWITSDKRGNYREPTKLLLKGVWINTYTNPGRYSRIKYGDDIFQHVEHWRDLGYKTGWSNYSERESGSWMKCRLPNFHGCLSNWLPSGSIQFKDIWI